MATLFYPSYVPSHSRPRPGLNPFISKVGSSSKLRCPISIISNFGKSSIRPHLQNNQKKNSIIVSATVADSSSTTTKPSPSSHPSSKLHNAEYLENEFGGKGIKFSRIADTCVVEMTVENGSSARLLLPSGLITSYKPLMWHGGCVEVLHTIVKRDSAANSVQGGIGLILNHNAEDGSAWFARDWAVQSVSAKPVDAIQVILRCCNNDGMLSVKYIVTLYDKVLTTAVLVDNISSSPIELKSSVMTHLTASTPDAASAIGLKGISYCTQPPLPSEFNIVSNIREESKPSSGWSFLQDLFGSKEKREEPATGDEEPEWAVEKDDFANLGNKMSRVYPTPNEEIRLNDRGIRHTLILTKVGFEEFYLSSPGSNSTMYGEHCYICTGPASMLQPLVLSPGEEWRAAQMLQNPNI